jgi:hypothetical protein
MSVPLPHAERRHASVLARVTHRLSELRVTEVAAAALLGAATFTYVRFLWPNSVVALDEGAFVYEAKRVLDGQVMYRDFFDLTGPLAQHLLALAYALFGVTIETARGTTALLHGIIVAFLYSILRRLGVRPSLAAAFCLVDPALFFPALPFASPHWFSTTITVIALWVALGGRVRGRRAVVAGVLAGLVAITQQPKGVALVAAVAVVVLRDGWTSRSAGMLIRALGACALGLLAVLGPTLIGFVAAAGFEPMFDALVRTPLGPYRQQPFVREGRWLLLDIGKPGVWRVLWMMPQMFVLDVLPFIVPVGAVRLVRQSIRGADAEERRPLFVAVIFSAFALLSIVYQPNYSHFGVVGPVYLALLAESSERLVRRLEAGSRTRIPGAVAALTVLALAALELHRIAAQAWSVVSVAVDTRFGRLQFGSPAEVEEIEGLGAALRAADAKSMVVYPCGAALYLVTETANPTRFQLLIPGYNTAEQFAEVEHTLETQRVPFVVRTLCWPLRESEDPLLPYLKQHYDQVALPRKHVAIPGLALFRRKAEGRLPGA